jgi:hypothetical protein
MMNCGQEAERKGNKFIDGVGIAPQHKNMPICMR